MEKLKITAVIVFIGLYLMLPLGWILNLVKFIKLDFRAPYKAELIRGVGVISGIGAITGYVKISDN